MCIFSQNFLVNKQTNSIPSIFDCKHKLLPCIEFDQMKKITSASSSHNFNLVFAIENTALYKYEEEDNSMSKLDVESNFEDKNNVIFDKE